MSVEKWLRLAVVLIGIGAGLAAFGCSDSPGLAVPGEGDLDISICDPAGGTFTIESTNEFFPMVVEEVSNFLGEEEGAAVETVRTVLDETEVVAGVTTRVIEERETVDGELVEVSRNFFAQAADGTICYFGEDVDTYEGGVVIGHEGAWRAGEGNNLPGIQIPAVPEVGMTYAQEYAPGVAEEHSEIVAMGEHLSVPAGEFDDTLRVIETSALDGDESLKIYVSGIGLAVDDTRELQ